MDPTYHIMNMLRTLEGLPHSWLENGWLKKVRFVSGLLGVLFIGITIVSLIFLFVDFQSMELRVTLSLGGSATSNAPGVARGMVIALAVLSFILALVCFLVDFLSRSIQRRNHFIQTMKGNIKDFSRSYEPEALILEA